MRIRLRFTKLGKIRFLGHRDLGRCWERALRRTELPMAYSEGFSPRPKLHYGLALPTVSESLAEYIDIDVTRPIDLSGLAQSLTDAMPDGVQVTGVAEIPQNADALQAVVDHCTWEFELIDTGNDDVAAKAKALMARDDVPLTFERKKKSITENVRPALVSIDVAPDLRDGAVVVTALLATKPRSIRPSEFLTCLSQDGDLRRLCRQEQWMTTDGELVALLAVGDPALGGVTPSLSTAS